MNRRARSKADKRAVLGEGGSTNGISMDSSSSSTDSNPPLTTDGAACVGVDVDADQIYEDQVAEDNPNSVFVEARAVDGGVLACKALAERTSSGFE